MATRKCPGGRIEYVDREVKVEAWPSWIPKAQFRPGQKVFVVSSEYDHTVIKCGFCGGSGGVIGDSKPKTCPKCEGKGQHERNGSKPTVIQTAIEDVVLNCRPYDHGFVTYWASLDRNRNQELRNENIFATPEEAQAAILARNEADTKKA
jgi:RecJ-like exonuclease